MEPIFAGEHKGQEKGIVQELTPAHLRYQMVCL